EETGQIPTMCLRIKLSAYGARKVLKVALSVGLLISGLSVMASGQAALPNAPGEYYGGIEISAEGALAIALRVSPSGEETGVKLVYSEVIPLTLGRIGNGEFAPQASEEAAQAVLKLQSRLRQQYQVPPERIYLIGASRLGADHPKDLISAIGN